VCGGVSAATVNVSGSRSMYVMRINSIARQQCAMGWEVYM
jgi:hypothetical protein